MKSMTLKLHETGELYDDATRRQRFSADFVRNLYKLVRAPTTVPSVAIVIAFSSLSC